MALCFIAKPRRSTTTATFCALHITNISTNLTHSLIVEAINPCCYYSGRDLIVRDYGPAGGGGLGLIVMVTLDPIFTVEPAGGLEERTVPAAWLLS